MRARRDLGGSGKKRRRRPGWIQHGGECWCQMPSVANGDPQRRPLRLTASCTARNLIHDDQPPFTCLK